MTFGVPRAVFLTILEEVHNTMFYAKYLTPYDTMAKISATVVETYMYHILDIKGMGLILLDKMCFYLLFQHIFQPRDQHIQQTETI
jgi:hypothetical protein